MPKNTKKLAKLVRRKLKKLSAAVAANLDKLSNNVMNDLNRLSSSLSVHEQILLEIDDCKCAKFGVYPF